MMMSMMKYAEVTDIVVVGTMVTLEVAVMGVMDRVRIRMTDGKAEGPVKM